MKYISEKRMPQLMDKISDFTSTDGTIFYDDLENVLKGFFSELDELTVTKLRQIGDIPYGKQVLLYNHEKFTISTIYPETNLFSEWLVGAKGWLAMPQYKPEE